MRNVFILFFLLIASSFQLVFSQEEEKHSILTDRFQFDIGIFIPSKTVKIGADGSSPGDKIDFGESFQFNDNEATLFLNFDWRFSKKWNLSAEYFSVINAHKLELEEDIIWEDITFEKGTFVRGGFGFNVYRIFIGRIFSQGLKHEFGGGLGVHALNTSAFIEGEVKIEGTDNFKFERKRVSALIPLPNIGLWYYFAPTPKWAFIVRGDWFGITINEYSGGLLNIAPGIKYQVFKNIGLGIDYRYFNVYANINKDSWKGKFDMSYQGPLFTINANF